MPPSCSTIVKAFVIVLSNLNATKTIEARHGRAAFLYTVCILFFLGIGGGHIEGLTTQLSLHKLPPQNVFKYCTYFATQLALWLGKAGEKFSSQWSSFLLQEKLSIQNRPLFLKFDIMCPRQHWHFYYDNDECHMFGKSVREKMKWLYVSLTHNESLIQKGARVKHILDID